MTNDVFSIAKRTGDLIVLKVNATDNFIVATHPYISREYDYISVTRGKEHVLTVIKTDGSTFNFHWGESGHTLISEGLKQLRDAVIDFIENQNHILLSWRDGKIDSAKVFYNKNYGKWQLTLEAWNDKNYFDSAYIWSKTAKSADDVFKEYSDIISCEWRKEIATTGIDVWRAVLS